MRRKSTRNTNKSPEKTVTETETPSKTRRSRRRKRSPSKSSDSEEEDAARNRTPQTTVVENTPDTTTKSHTPSDDETSQEPVWKVTSSEDTPRGEIQKLKICLTRPSPDSPEKLKTRRSKSNSQTEDDATTSSEDKSSTRRTRSRGSPFVDEAEEKKGKGKSKGKHKSKIEQSSPQLHEDDVQTMNIEISENAQVTHQSPSIDKRVDIETDYNKVDDVDGNGGDNNVKQNLNTESTQIEQRTHDDTGTADNQSDVNTEIETKNLPPTPDSDKDDDDDEPLISIKRTVHEEQNRQLTTINEESNDKQSYDLEKQQDNNTEEIDDSANKDTEAQKNDSEKLEHVEAISVEDQNTEQSVVATESSDKEQDVEEENAPIGNKNNVQQHCSADITTEKTDDETSKATCDAIELTRSDSLNSSHDDRQEETPPKVESESSTKIRRKLKRDNLITSNETISAEKRQRATTKWLINSETTSCLMKIDLDTLQVLCPTIEFPEEPDLNLDLSQYIERRKSQSDLPIKKIERNNSNEYKSDSSEKLEHDQEIEDKSNIIAFNRKISIVEDTASKLRPPPSPAKNPTSNVLFITNLVRPFTLKQLKELLERTGKIYEDGFWTDKIKSKCYVRYENTEEAETTRNALHGVQWPIGNGKKLIIDFATVEDLENAKNPPAPPSIPIVEQQPVPAKENVEPIESKPKNEEKKSKEVERRKPDGPIREWDIGKKDARRERSRSRERVRKHRRSPTPLDDFISKKQRKEDVLPQKLMDDLFLKTKATPSIYWQPLSPEEIATKQQQRLIRMEEHKRRMEESSRMKPRDGGRGNFRRRYD